MSHLIDTGHHTIFHKAKDSMTLKEDGALEVMFRAASTCPSRQPSVKPTQRSARECLPKPQEHRFLSHTGLTKKGEFRRQFSREEPLYAGDHVRPVRLVSWLFSPFFSDSD